VQPLNHSEWPMSIADLEADFAGRLNVYRVMAHHPALLRAWQNFRNHVVHGTELGEKRSEIIILRTGVRLASRYEWSHHVVRGRKAGLEDARILSIKGPYSGMQAEDAVLCRAVDELFDDKQLKVATLRTLRDAVGDKGVMDVMATVAHYQMLGFLLGSFDIPLDRDIEAELAKCGIG
jgi:4-carboxymuconolactone decarboxylase